MKPYFEIKQSGNTFTVLRNTLNLSTAVYLLPERSPSLATSSYKEVIATLTNAMNKGNLLAGRFSESAFNDENRELLSIIANGIKKFRLDALALKEKTALKRKDLLTFKSSHNDGEIRTQLKGISPLKVFEIAIKDPVVCSAILEFPNLSGLTTDLLKQLENAQIQNTLVERFKSQIPAKPSLNNMFPDGGDVEFAKSKATEFIAKLESDDGEVKLAEGTLKQMVSFYAVVKGSSNQQEAFNEIFA